MKTSDELVIEHLEDLIKTLRDDNWLKTALRDNYDQIPSGVMKKVIEAIEAKMRKIGNPDSSPPTCEECDLEMHEFEDPNTGATGWGCDGCGWTHDS